MALSLFVPRDWTVRMSAGESENSDVSDPEASADMHMSNINIIILNRLSGSNPL